MKSKNWFYLLFYCLIMLTVFEARVMGAGISSSPHNIPFWLGQDSTKTGFTPAGLCAFCHVPHSSKGERLFPEKIETSLVAQYGNVAAICYQCHGTDAYLGSNNILVNAVVFDRQDLAKTFSSENRDSHPVKGTGGSPTLQNTAFNTTAAAWPWNSGTNRTWNTGDGTLDIECTSCHNPHDWSLDAYGSTSRRKFLRAPIYNPAAVGTAENPKNFCSYCHTRREDTTRSNAVGTHPVGGDVSFSKYAAYPNSLYKDTTYMFQSFRPDADLIAPGNKAGKAIWDNVGSNGFIGARLYNNDIIICQSCHMPHGVQNSRDDLYSDTGTTVLRVGPLLAINNNASVKDPLPSLVPTQSQFPASSERSYVLPAGQKENLLCEWCHGMTPGLKSSAESTAAFAHPVNNFPTSTSDNQPTDFAKFGVLAIKYPGSGWLKYRESEGIKAYSGDRVPSTDKFIVCLSCHEPHQSQPYTPIIKLDTAVSTTQAFFVGSFCDGCHKDVAMGSGVDNTYFTDWTTHPSGSTARIRTADSRVSGNPTVYLPNRAKLEVFGTTTIDGGYISCWTCHKAHTGVASPMLADYQSPYSQICVNCHCEGTNDTTITRDSTAAWAYGTTGTFANPSPFYMEGAWPNWWAKPVDLSRANSFIISNTRYGSHFIGSFTGTKPKTGDATAGSPGWLGDRDVDRAPGDIKMYAVEHKQLGTEGKDHWLDTSFFMETAWATGFIPAGLSASEQKSRVGSINNDSTRFVISCQTCHGVHNTAKGVADDSTVSRLLLASNYDSYMCKRCHIPKPTVDGKVTGTHQMHDDGWVGHHYPYDTIVTKTGNTVDITSGTNAYATPIAPANYPSARMNCDACHSVHSGDSKMGAMIVEGNDSATGKRIPAGYENKVPTYGERNDEITCDLCHGQGL